MARSFREADECIPLCSGSHIGVFLFALARLLRCVEVVYGERRGLAKYHSALVDYDDLQTLAACWGDGDGGI
jgi:hypothetical protein